MPAEKNTRHDDSEHKRIQRAAAQSMADQGYPVTCQGIRYTPAEQHAAKRCEPLRHGR